MAVNDVNIRIRAQDDTKGAFGSVKSSLGGLRSAIFSVQGALAGLASGLVVKSIVDSNRSFQSLQASLITFTGSTEAANQVFGQLQEFARTTPFALEEVVGGFNKLVARGINPSIESLTMFGNIAGGTGKTLDQFVEAVADAVTGEFERLKEFGIKANVEGDRVKMTFGGVTTSIGNNAKEINAYLENLGRTKFGGGMERQMETLNGKFSNFGDAVFNLGVALGEAGLNKVIAATLGFLTNLIDRMTDATKAGLNFFETLRFGIFGESLKKEADIALAEIKRIENAIASIDIADPEVAGTLASLETDLKEARQKYTDLQKYMNEKPVRVNVTAPLLGNSQSTEVKKFVAGMTPYFEEIASAVGSAIKSSDVIRAKDFAKEIEYLDELFFSGAIDVQIYDSAMKKLSGTTSKFGEEVAKVNSPLEDFHKSMPTLNQAMESVVVGGMKSLEDSLVNLVNGTMSVKDAFKSMANSVINDLIRMAIQQQITAPLAQMFGLQAAAPSVPLTGKAIGGSVQAGKPYMVGERGAEMFVPNQSGSIIPNGQMGGGGTTIVQNINVTTGVQQTVRAEIMTLMPQIANAAKSAVADAKLRGGSYAAAMR